jgi:hypothetical protein
MGSQNNSRPNSIFSGVVGLSTGALASSGNVAILPGSYCMILDFIFYFLSPEQAAMNDAAMQSRVMILIFISEECKCGDWLIC